MSRDSDTQDVQRYVDENTDLLREVLKYSEEPYAQAVALVLLNHGSSEPELDAVIQELERCR